MNHSFCMANTERLTDHNFKENISLLFVCFSLTHCQQLGCRQLNKAGKALLVPLLLQLLIRKNIKCLFFRWIFGFVLGLVFVFFGFSDLYQKKSKPNDCFWEFTRLVLNIYKICLLIYNQLKNKRRCVHLVKKCQFC